MNNTRRSIWIAANTSWYVYNFRSRLIREMIRAGYAVSVLAPADDYTERLRSLGVAHFDLHLDNEGTNPIRDSLVILRLVTLFRRESPAIILTYTPKVNIYIAIAARVIGVPVIANISGLGSGFIKGGWLSAIIKLLYRISMHYPAKVFFQNEDDKNLFLAKRLVDPCKAERIPGSGVDVDKFHPAARCTRSGNFCFLLVARLIREKGVYEYIEAARVVKQARSDVDFHILGFIDPDYPGAVSHAELSAWQSEGIIKYLGAVDNVIGYYAGASCVVLPSYREGCPRSLLEACSMGLPVIATDTPGCRDVVSHNVNGLLCKVADSADLAAKMLQLLNWAPDMRQRLGVAGRQKVLQEFDESIVINRYIEVIAGVLAINPALAAATNL